MFQDQSPWREVGGTYIPWISWQQWNDPKIIDVKFQMVQKYFA